MRYETSADGFGVESRRGAARTAALVAGVGAVALAGAGFWWVSSRPPAGADAGTPAPEVAGVKTLADLVTSASVHAARGDTAAAEAIYRSAIEQYPEDTDLRTGYAELLVGLERYEEAYRQLEQVVRTSAGDAELLFRAGQLAATIGDHDAALVHFTQAQGVDPGNPVYPLVIGNEQMRRGEFEAANASFVRASVLAPDLVHAWGALAKLALRQNRPGLALQHAERAIELQPDEPAWRLYQARAMKRQGDHEGALLILTALDKGVQAQPAYLQTIGECLGLMGRPADAAARYAEAARASEDADLAFQTGVWFQRAGDVGEARRWGREAVRRGHPRAAGWLDGLE